MLIPVKRKMSRQAVKRRLYTPEIPQFGIIVDEKIVLYDSSGYSSGRDSFKTSLSSLPALKCVFLRAGT